MSTGQIQLQPKMKNPLSRLRMQGMSDARPLDTRPHQIFLSYASADRDVAQKIAEKLRQSNLRVWFDAYKLQAGDSLTARIQDAIMAGDYLVVLLSPDSVRSQWMKRELNASLSLELQSRTITILPVLIADGEIPSALAEIRHIDLRAECHPQYRLLTARCACI